MFTIRVPATSANLGAGFDTFGLALSMYNDFSFEERDDGKLVIRGVEKKYQGKDNLVYRAMQKVFNEVDYTPKGIFIHERNNIPFSRGLGSSASCIVAGLVAANHMAGSPLTPEQLFEIGVKMEGHPDNIAPAFFGGLVCAVMTPYKTFFIREDVSPAFRFFAAIPDFDLPTVKAREALPEEVPYPDAVFNVGRATMTFLALSKGLTELIGVSVNDKLHEPYRKSLINHYKEVTRTAKRMGSLNSYISGAGPTLMFITKADDERFYDKMRFWMKENLPDWDFIELKPVKDGVLLRD